MRKTWALVGLVLAAGASAQGPAVAGPAKASCTVDRKPASDAAAALSREEYDAALDLYRKMGDGNEARAGVIRAQLDEDKVAEADAAARDWVAKEPKSAAATVTLGEVEFRAGKPDEAYRMVRAARVLDACNARGYLLEGMYEDVTANFALSKGHFETAHKLAPNDPEILNAWIGTLPRAQRVAQYAVLAKDDRLVNAKDRERLAQFVGADANYHKGDCSVVEWPGEATIPIQTILDGPGHPTSLALDVGFNGKRRRLEIDTGASGLILSRSAAGGLGLTREEQVTSGGIGDRGGVKTSIAHVASVKIGNLEFRNCPVEILEKRSALDSDGLIGGNVFAKYLVTLDFPKRQLRLNSLPPRPGEAVVGKGLQTAAAKVEQDGVDTGDSEEETPHNRYVAPEMKDWTPVFRTGHDLMLPVRVGGANDTMAAQERLFIVDTGASTMLVSPDAARVVTKVHGDESTGIRGISGDVDKVYSTGKFTFYFARLKQTVEGMTSIDTTKISHDTGIEISGFLGAPVLYLLAVHIDYRDNLMKFDYDKPK